MTAKRRLAPLRMTAGAAAELISTSTRALLRPATTAIGIMRRRLAALIVRKRVTRCICNACGNSVETLVAGDATAPSLESGSAVLACRMMGGAGHEPATAATDATDSLRGLPL